MLWVGGVADSTPLVIDNSADKSLEKEFTIDTEMPAVAYAQ